MKKDNLNFCIFIIFYITVIIMSFSEATYSFLSEAVSYVFPIITIILAIFNSGRSIKKNPKVALIVFSFLVMLASVFITSGGAGSFLSIINFACLLYITKYVKIDKKRKKILLFLTLIFYAINAVNSYGIWDRYISGEKIINPNTIAMNIVYSTIMLTVLIMSSKTRYKVLVGASLYVFSLTLTMSCHCRNALVVLAIYAAIIVIPKMRGIISARIVPILWFLVIVGVLVPILYSNKIFGEVSFIEQLSEKSVYSGREIIWRNMLSAFSEDKFRLLMGVGSHYETSIGIITNYHTWYLGIIYMYGIPIFLSYYYMLIDKIKNMKRPELKVGFIAIFIMGIFETAAIWLYAQCLIFLLILLDNMEPEIINVRNRAIEGDRR